MTKERAKQKAIQYRIWAEKNEQKAKEIYSKWHNEMKDFDWTQPILLGHHSQKRHQKIYERRNRVHEKVRELEEKAKRMKEKANNLEYFTNRNKGNAEKTRQTIRDLNDKIFKVGSKVYDIVFGAGIIKRVNKKTYTIAFSSGMKCTRDKSFIQEIKYEE